MDKDELRLYFKKTLAENPDMAEGVAAIATLIHFIQSVETLTELDKSLKVATEVLKSSETKMVASIASGCELFHKFISRTDKIEMRDFEEIKKVIMARGQTFLSRAATSRQKIAQKAKQFIQDESKIFVHSRSRVVLEVLKEAAAEKKHFLVYVTESLPDGSGKQMLSDLKELEIPAILVLDSAIGYVMERVDMVLVGAEGVAEDGGIINKIGTYTLAMSAKALNKPFYVFAESFKFMRIYPLNNRRGIPAEFKRGPWYPNAEVKVEDHPWVDYTPPSYIRYLFTDLGVLTPAAVSDELIKLYV